MLREAIEVAALSDDRWGISPKAEAYFERSRGKEVVDRVLGDPDWYLPTPSMTAEAERIRRRQEMGLGPEEVDHLEAAPLFERATVAMKEEGIHSRRERVAQKIARGVALAKKNPRFRGARDAANAEARCRASDVSEDDMKARKSPVSRDAEGRASRQRDEVVTLSYAALETPTYRNLSSAVGALTRFLSIKKNTAEDLLPMMSSADIGRVYAGHARRCLSEQRPSEALSSAKNAVSSLEPAPHQWRMLLVRAFISTGDVLGARQVLVGLSADADLFDKALVEKWSKVSLWSGPDKRLQTKDVATAQYLSELSAKLRSNEQKIQEDLDKKTPLKKQLGVSSMSPSVNDDESDGRVSDYEWVTDSEDDDEIIDHESDCVCSLEVFPDLPALVVSQSQLTAATSLEEAARTAVDEWCSTQEPGLLNAKQADALERVVRRAARGFAETRRNEVERRRRERSAYVRRRSVHQVFVAARSVRPEKTVGRIFGRARLSADFRVEECEHRPDPDERVVARVFQDKKKKKKTTEPLFSESVASVVGPEFAAWTRLQSQRFFLDSTPVVDSRTLAMLYEVFKAERTSAMPAEAPMDENLAETVTSAPSDYPLVHWSVGRTPRAAKTRMQEGSVIFSSPFPTFSLPSPLAIAEWPPPPPSRQPPETQELVSPLLPHWVLVAEVWNDDAVGSDLLRQFLGEARMGIADLLALLHGHARTVVAPKNATDIEPAVVTLPLRPRRDAKNRERKRFAGGSVDLLFWPPAAWSAPPDSVDDDDSCLMRFSEQGEEVARSERPPPRQDRPGVLAPRQDELLPS